MSKTETSAKILKSKKIEGFIIIISAHIQGRVNLFLWTKHETNSWSTSSSREWQRILAAILDFVEVQS